MKNVKRLIVLGLFSTALSGCANFPGSGNDGAVLSRLDAGTQGAVGPAPEWASVQPDPEQALKRYNELDQQALRDQERQIAAQSTAQALKEAAAASAPQVYGGYGYGRRSDWPSGSRRW